MTYATRPEFVTFTGLDDRTNLDDCAALGARYPIEWATLVGGRLGKNRYPLKKLDEITLWDYERKAVHLCGVQAAEAQINPRMLNRLSETFRRIQVNRVPEAYDLPTLREWAYLRFSTDIVVQRRKREWPEDWWLSYLYDCSGGKERSFPLLLSARRTGSSATRVEFRPRT